jgi:hypothetical protein
MYVGAASEIFQAYPIDRSRSRRRRFDPRHDRDEPIDGEFTVLEEVTAAPVKRRTVAARAGETARGAQLLLRGTSRSYRDLDDLGLLRAYLPYEEFLGAYVDAFA